MPIQYDSQGIITQTLSEIINERENTLKTVMGEEFIIDKTSPIGNMELADSNSEALIHELIAYLIPNQIDAKTATGIFLDAICEKNRIYRKQANYTTLDLVIGGDKNTQFLSGDITITDNTSGIYYDLNEDCIINDNNKVYAQFKCQSIGDYYPLSSTTFTIQTPMAGLNSVTLDSENSNLVVGNFTETDDELRRRRELSISLNSTSILESIKSAIYSLDGVKYVVPFENDTETTDTDGLPMKSFEMVVYGGDEDEITDTIFNKKPVGTRAYGTTVKVKTDSEGSLYNIGYTKATQINIGMEIKVKSKTLQAESWKQTIIEAIKTQFENIQGIGVAVKDYNYTKILTDFPEITDITSVLFYNTDEAEEEKVKQYTIAKKEIAILDTSKIEIIIETE